MQRKSIISLVLTVLVVGILSYFVSGLIFKVPAKNAKAPTIEAIDQNFPDVKNDPNYSSFLNAKALDPTQPVKIGNNANTKPFNSQ